MAKNNSRQQQQQPRQGQGQHKGRFTLQDERFILENYTTLPVAEIAQRLDRSITSVKSWYKRNNIVPPNIKSGEDKDLHLKKQLYGEPFFETVRKQLTQDELDSFIRGWITIVTQFDQDILASEKLSLKKYLLLEIMHDRSTQLQKNFMEDLEQKRIDLVKCKESSNYKKINSLTNEIAECNNNYNNALRQTLDIAKQQTVAQKELKMSREQRVKDVRSAKENWGKTLELLSNESIRDEISKELEILRAAKDNSKMKLMKYHRFIDNKEDNPLLSYETIEFLEKLEAKENEKN